MTANFSIQIFKRIENPVDKRLFMYKKKSLNYFRYSWL